jgi:protein ImuA
MEVAKEDIISKLRQDILRWEGFRPPGPGEAGSFGLGPVEAAFPNGVFPTGVIHEFISLGTEDTAACGGFIAGIVKTLLEPGGACLWVSWSRRIYPPALKLFGVDPDRVVFVDVPLLKDVLWVAEEALKCEWVAVEKSRVTGFILRKEAKRLNITACVSRWKISHVPSELRRGMPGVGAPRWRVELSKVRNGNPGVWIVEWSRRRFNTVVKEKAIERLRQYA